MSVALFAYPTLGDRRYARQRALAAISAAF